MLVSDVMTRGVECVSPDATLQEAAAKMKALDVGPLPVCGPNDKLVGMITDRDITIRAVAAGRDPNTTPVGEIMTATGLVCCHDDQDVREAVALMRRHGVRRLPVVDRQNRLVGMIALADIARSQNPEITAAALEGVSQPTAAELGR
jgi:CBS domain-containing protein